jgi:hypothetical protein
VNRGIEVALMPGEGHRLFPTRMHETDLLQVRCVRRRRFLERAFRADVELSIGTLWIA